MMIRVQLTRGDDLSRLRVPLAETNDDPTSAGILDGIGSTISGEHEAPFSEMARERA
jgi:hypothetical protein